MVELVNQGRKIVGIVLGDVGFIYVIADDGIYFLGFSAWMKVNAIITATIAETDDDAKLFFGFLAIELGMNQNSISRYETGEREADYATLCLFADFFDVSIDYLLERTDKKEVNR